MRTIIARIGVTGAGAVLAVGLFAFAPAAGATDSAGHGVNHEDSSCFTGTGQTQGRSHSDPDGMSNGGADKPGCTGGFDADRDGNNGCGNDADREDDNNGNCGRKKAGGGEGVSTPTSSTTTSTTTTTTTSGQRVTPAIEPGSVEPSDCQIDPKEATDCAASATVAGTGTGARLTEAGTGRATGGTGTPSGTDTGAAVSGAGGTSGSPSAAIGTDATTAAAPGTEVLGETLSRPSALARTGAGAGVMTLLGVVLCGSGRLAVLARRLLRIG